MRSLQLALATVFALIASYASAEPTDYSPTIRALTAALLESQPEGNVAVELDYSMSYSEPVLKITFSQSQDETYLRQVEKWAAEYATARASTRVAARATYDGQELTQSPPISTRPKAIQLIGILAVASILFGLSIWIWPLLSRFLTPVESFARTLSVATNSLSEAAANELESKIAAAKSTLLEDALAIFASLIGRANAFASNRRELLQVILIGPAIVALVVGYGLYSFMVNFFRKSDPGEDGIHSSEAALRTEIELLKARNRSLELVHDALKSSLSGSPQEQSKTAELFEFWKGDLPSLKTVEDVHAIVRELLPTTARTQAMTKAPLREDRSTDLT